MKKKLSRRDFLKLSGTAIVGSTIVGPISAYGGANPGAKVEPMTILSPTAALDPVRPESARLISRAFADLGWDVGLQPLEYNQNVQKVFMEHDYDMWMISIAGTASRIDPNLHMYKVHHTSQYKKGGWNWTGISDPELDKLVETQQTEMDREKRREIVFKAQERIHELQPMNILSYYQTTQAYRSDQIKGVVPAVGEGIGSFWTDINVEVIKGDGYLRSGMTSPLKNLNPVASKDIKEFWVLRMIYDRLLRLDPQGNPKAWAAESYKIINPTTLDLKLRKGMKFHDGVNVTVEDVKFTFDYLKKWKAPYFLATLKKIKSVEITGKHSIRLSLSEPYAPIISNLLTEVFILPKHIWQDIPEKVDVSDPLNFDNKKPIGSGPYVFDYWDRGRELKLTAFKEHFNPPKSAGFIRQTYGSHDALAAAIEKGECDRNRFVLKPSLIEDLQKVQGVVAKGYPNIGFYNLSYNTRRAPLNDIAFRKALAHALPKDLMIETLIGGMAEKGGSIIAPNNKFWHNSAVKPYPTDMSKAKRILSEAGYTWDNKGKLHYPA